MGGNDIQVAGNVPSPVFQQEESDAPTSAMSTPMHLAQNQRPQTTGEHGYLAMTY